jgi:hypothetical protein
MFTGRFAKLSSLLIVQYPNLTPEVRGVDSFFTLVANTAENLRSITVHGATPPKVLTQPNVLSKVVLLSLPKLPSYRPIPLHNLQNLTLDSYDGDPPITLPSITFFKGCNFANLANCCFEQVKTLKIQLRDGEKHEHPPFEMPCLVSLSLSGPNVFTCLLDLQAPNLVDLSLVDNGYPNCTRKRSPEDHSKAATNVFKDERHRVHVRPTVLKLCLSLKVSPMLLILRSWSQVEHLELHWNRQFQWNGHFLRAFCQDNNNKTNKRSKPICPNLVTLRVQMKRWQNEDLYLAKWGEGAKKILKARLGAGLPLEKIVWTEWPQLVRIGECTLKDVQ